MGTLPTPSPERASRAHSLPVANSRRRFSVARATRSSSSENKPVPGDLSKDSAHAAVAGKISSITLDLPAARLIVDIVPTGHHDTVRPAPEVKRQASRQGSPFVSGGGAGGGLGRGAA